MNQLLLAPQSGWDTHPVDERWTLLDAMISHLYASVRSPASPGGGAGPAIFEWTATADGAQSQELPAAPSFCAVHINGLLQRSDYASNGSTLSLSAALNLRAGDLVSCLYWL